MVHKKGLLRLLSQILTNFQNSDYSTQVTAIVKCSVSSWQRILKIYVAICMEHCIQHLLMNTYVIQELNLYCSNPIEVRNSPRIQQLMLMNYSCQWQPEVLKIKFYYSTHSTSAADCREHFQKTMQSDQ